MNTTKALVVTLCQTNTVATSTTQHFDTIDLAIRGLLDQSKPSVPASKRIRKVSAKPVPVVIAPPPPPIILADPRAIASRRGLLKVQPKTVKAKMNEQAGKQWRREHIQEVK